MDKLTFQILYDRSSSREIRRAGTRETDLRLPRRALLSLEGDSRGALVTCHSGFVWLTQEGDRRDHILTAGKQFSVSCKGMVLIQSLQDASLNIAISGT